MCKINGGSEGVLNRHSGVQKFPYMATLASHVTSVDDGRDIARQIVLPIVAGFSMHKQNGDPKAADS